MSDPRTLRRAALLFPALAGAAAAQTNLHNNGVLRGGAPPYGLATGEQTSTGVPAPAGALWSELQTGNYAMGFNAQSPLGNRLADDFTITDPGGWRITTIDVFAYLTDHAPSAPSPFTALTLRIWRGRPGDPGATIVFGDTTTNRLAASAPINVYRADATGHANNRTRAIWANTLLVNAVLPPGTYWLDIGQNDGFNPPVTIAGARAPASANARQFLGPPDNVWIDLADPGDPNGPFPPAPQELPFIIRGDVLSPGGGCYPNCDGSTTIPFLNVSDFICFQSRYVAGDPYANCDQSTSPPTLNVNDFLCFQAAFVAGCSAP